MMITELKDIEIDPGAPTPKVLANEIKLYVCFYSCIQTVGIDGRQVTVVGFKHPLIHKFGMPNDETFTGHPLYKIGLKPYLAQRLDESPWIEELKQINRVHPYYDHSMFNEHKHYILAFHDTTFECIAKGYEVQSNDSSMKEVVASLLQLIVQS